jgi:hypothetical protein
LFTLPLADEPRRADEPTGGRHVEAARDVVIDLADRTS